METTGASPGRANPTYLSASKLHGADGHRDRGLGGVDDGGAEGGLERGAVAGHAGTAHDDDVGAVLVAQLLADLDHAVERLLAGGRLGHAHVERSLAGETVGEPHLPQVAHVPANRALA